MKAKPTRLLSRAFLRSAHWLMVQTTDYVELRHAGSVHVRIDTQYDARVREANDSVKMPPYPRYFKHPETGAITDEDGKPSTMEKAERHAARYRAAAKRRDKAVIKAKAAIVAEARSDPGTARYHVSNGNPVMGRNLARRVRVMRAPRARALAALDRQIMALQQRRQRLLVQAWEEGIPVSPPDLLTLSDLSRTPARSKQMARDIPKYGNLDHHDTVWPGRYVKPAPRPAESEAA